MLIFIFFNLGQEKDAEVPQEWIDMTGGCIKEVERQIQEEINASIQYLTMAAHFSQDTVNRPGFAEFFFKAAGEEREHATKLIEYLLMRGQLTKKVTNLIVFKVNINIFSLIFFPHQIPLRMKLSFSFVLR